MPRATLVGSKKGESLIDILRFRSLISICRYRIYEWSLDGGEGYTSKPGMGLGWGWSGARSKVGVVCGPF
jgi:hypothetical protein